MNDRNYYYLINYKVFQQLKYSIKINRYRYISRKRSKHIILSNFYFDPEFIFCLDTLEIIRYKNFNREPSWIYPDGPSSHEFNVLFTHYKDSIGRIISTENPLSIEDYEMFILKENLLRNL